jgi:hypothetical protein
MKTKIKFRGKAFTTTLVVIALTCVSQIAFSQNRLTFEFRPGVNFPTGDLGDADLKTGCGFEGVLAYRFMTHLAVYAGWGWNRFQADESFAGVDVDFEETGYTYGLQFIHPIGQLNMNVLLRAGALSNHIEVENSSGDIIADSGHGYDSGIGWQVEGGLAVPLGEKWLVMPTVRYRSLPRELNIGAVTTDVDLNYISLGVGISRIF